MSNKKIVEAYMVAFNQSNHSKILECLTEDVIWEMPGFFYHNGKVAFDKEIENDAFEGRPEIKLTLLVEEGNIVVAEGTVKSRMKGGEPFNAVFCDVFYFEQNKIKKLTSYVMQIKN